jgi:anti-sigma factor RsiW
MLRCHAVQGHITAYIHGELPLKARRRVAAHLERCSRCKAAYGRQRELVRELERELPRVGQAQSGQLSRVWSKVQKDIQAPAPRPTLQYRMSYGLAALILVLVMAVPFLMSLNDDEPVTARTLPAHAVAFATTLPDQRVLNRVPANALSRTAPAATRVRLADFVTPEAALTPAPLP